MTARQKLNRRKHQEIVMGLATIALALTVTALLVMSALF